MQADTLSLTFAALADPTRRAILKRLAAGPADWVAEYRGHWDESFDRLGVYLQELHTQRRKEVRDARRRKR